MTDTVCAQGCILTPGGWIHGELGMEGERIASIEGRRLAPGERPFAPFVLPGFIDPHVHGGNGFDCLEGIEAVRGMVRFHAAHGTVAILPTTSTAPADIVETALRNIAAVMADPHEVEGDIRGAHLEGPFISPERLGAQDAPMEGDPDLAAAWARLCPLRVATVAPEIPGGIEVARQLASFGTRVQIGHSIAEPEMVERAFAAGFTGFTHLFNAMTGVDHKAPGIASWAFAHATHAELVCDLRHVRPTTLLAAFRAIPQAYAITDAVGVAGLPDGEHSTRNERRRLVKTGFDAFLADKPDTRAGSVVTMIDVFRCLMSLGLSMELVSELTSTRAADYLGFSDLGRLQPGRTASAVILGEELSLDGVIVRGLRIR